jgi:hypothetical protein
MTDRCPYPESVCCDCFDDCRGPSDGPQDPKPEPDTNGLCSGFDGGPCVDGAEGVCRCYALGAF